jgi:hypothetical protein
VGIEMNETLICFRKIKAKDEWVTSLGLQRSERIGNPK